MREFIQQKQDQNHNHIYLGYQADHYQSKPISLLNEIRQMAPLNFSTPTNGIFWTTDIFFYPVHEWLTNLPVYSIFTWDNQTVL
jgi:hypothetical protein